MRTGLQALVIVVKSVRSRKQRDSFRTVTVSLAQIKNLIATSKVARAVGGATVALMILSACLIILFRISDSANDGSLSLSALSYSGFFLTMCIVYLVRFYCGRISHAQTDCTDPKERAS